MSVRLSSQPGTTIPFTGIPMQQGSVRITQDGGVRVSQTTGEPPGGLNELPGTDPMFPGDDVPIVRDAESGDTRVTEDGLERVTLQTYDPTIGLPRGFIEVPNTGPLT